MSKLRFCVDCKHYHYTPSPPGIDPHNCERPDTHAKADLVTGQRFPGTKFKCHAERQSEDTGRCGPGGDFFEPK